MKIYLFGEYVVRNGKLSETKLSSLAQIPLHARLTVCGCCSLRLCIRKYFLLHYVLSKELYV